MRGTNEGNPHGVPLSYDWANGPAVVMGNNASGWQAITSWGALYEAAEGNPATNTRVNIRNMQAYLLQKSTGKWMLLQNTSKPNGGAYLEDFSGNVNKLADVRTEGDGTISATAGRLRHFRSTMLKVMLLVINTIEILISGGEFSVIIAKPILGGLHHEYRWSDAA